MNTNTWAAVAVHFDDVEYVDYPRIGQPKLNGFRARWDGATLTSRQGEIWNRVALPHLYDKLDKWSAKYPGVVLDGELYCHGMPFQEVEKRCAVKRQVAHRDCGSIDYHAFDIISDDDAEARQMTLCQIYQPWVAVCRVASQREALQWMRTFIEHGYEGMVLRSLRGGYKAGKTESLVKLKPMKYNIAVVLDCYEGQGKYTNALGGFNVRMGQIEFNVGGGLITEEQRRAVWSERHSWRGRKIVVGFRDFFVSGKPVQPQIIKLEVK